MLLALLAGCGQKDDGQKKHDGPRALPVVALPAKTGNFPVYLDALGSVTALNTVTIRSRVDGEVISVKYEEGQMVKKGDLLVEIDPRQYQAALQQAQGQLSRDQAMLQNAQADLDRYNAARETVSQQQIDTAKASVAEYEGAIKVDQGTIANAELQLSYCKITAPLTGKIGLRAVDEGNIVHASDSTGLATITQLQPIAVIFNLPEVNLPSVLSAAKDSQKVIADIFDASRTRKLASGALQAIDNQIDATTATVRIKAQFDNADGTLFPNQFVNVRLLVNTLNGVVLAPTSAVQNSPDTQFVYVVKSDDTVEMRPVTVSAASSDFSVIEKGLAAGEQVVTQGLDKLAPGMSVKAHGPSTRASGGDKDKGVGATKPAGEAS